MNADLSAICYLLAVALSVYYVVVGLMDLLKKKQPHEADDTAVISRQLRGMGYLVLSSFVIGLGAYLCLGATGAVGKSLKQLMK